MRRSASANWILFGFFCLLFIVFVIWQIAEQFFMINENFALLVLTVSPVLKQYNLPKVQIGLLVILFIPLFGILNYSYSFTDADTTYTYSAAKFMGISPIVSFFLLIYIIINFNVIGEVFKRLWRGSEAEQSAQHDKMVRFYYEKFKQCSDEELVEIKSKYSKYPAEAREAIDKISLGTN